MRGFAFCLVGSSFLLLIAFSWLGAENAASVAASPPSLASRSPASTSSNSREEIRRLTTCLEGNSCHASRAEVADALSVALAEHFTNFGSDSDLARIAVQSSSPLAQAVGLRMLASLPPSGENLSALGNGLRHASDPALAKGAILELERYLGSSYETDAQRIVETMVGYGERSPAQAAASMARPFINEHSYEEFKELLSRLSPGAEATQFLKTAILEYERNSVSNSLSHQ